MVQKKLPLINSAHGSETRNIINELIKLFNGMGYTYNESLQKAQDILDEAQQTNDMNESVQQQINTLIAESGTSDAEILQARVDFKGVEHPVIKERLDKTEKRYDKDYIKRHANTLPSTNMTTSKSKKVLNTFIDDDGNRALLSKLKPLSEEYNIPFVAALIGETVERGQGITPKEALELQDDLGWEIASHSYNHQAMGDYTDPDLIDLEIRYSQEYLRSFGLDVKNIVYPFGQSSKEVRDAVSRYYNCGVGTLHGTNTPPLRAYRLRRVEFPNSAANKNLQWYKNIVDDAIENDEWIIWMLHCGMSQHDEENQTILEDLIVYIQDQNVETVTLQEGWERYGNVFSVNDEAFYIGSDGTNNMINYQFVPIDNSTARPTIDGTMSPRDFESNKVFSSLYSLSASDEGMPTNSSGVFTVISSQTPNYSQQTYVTNDTAYIRHASADGESWRDWYQLATSKPDLTATNSEITIPANTVYRITINASGILQSDKNILIPEDGNLIPMELMWTYYWRVSGGINLKIHNTSSSPKTLPAINWVIKRTN